MDDNEPDYEVGPIEYRISSFRRVVGRGMDPTLLNGAIKRGEMVPERMYAKTADATARLVIDFHPADPMDRPDIDTFEITLLAPRGVGFRRCEHWYVDLNRERDPADNGKVTAVYDGSVREGVDNLTLAEADEAACRKVSACYVSDAGD